MNNLKRFVVFGGKLCSILFLFLGTIQITVAQKSEESELTASQCGQFALRNPDYYRISSNASSIITADFNNDAIPDVAAMMPNTNSIAIALGNNQSGFSEARDFVAGVSPQEAVAGDFNHDGELDLAVTSALDRLVNIMLGDGQGNFTLSGSYPVGGSPGKVQTGDFNNDGWLDLVVGNTESPNIGLSIFFGSANGFTAANPATIPLNGVPRSIRVADFNNDGNFDIMAVAQNSVGSGLPSYIRLFQGNNDGSFTDALTLTLGEFYTLESADFNSDGFADFAIFGQPNLSVRVYLNNRNGGFDTPVEIPLSNTNSSFQSLVAGDLNNDGKVDLATGSVILLNDGNANFTVRSNSDSLSNNFVLADFNGDGIVDEASPGDISDFNTPAYSTFVVAYGTGSANFIVPTYLQGIGNTSQTITGDFNNDGRQDIVTGNGGFSFNQIQIAFQNADGSFTVSRISVNSGTANNFTIVAAADFNNDGFLDIATNVAWARSIVILINNGNGQFTTSGVTLNSSGFAFSLEYFQPGDFNNDGYTDFIALSNSSYLVVLNNGSGGGFTVQPYVSNNSLQGYKTTAVGDFNGDGNQDFVIARSNSAFYYRGNGNGTFDLANLYQLPSAASMIRSSDFNNDGRSDFVVVTGGSFSGGSPGLAVFIADRNGSFSQTDSTISGTPNDIVISDLNNDSIKDFLVVNSPNNYVTLFAGNGNGSFTAQPSVITLNSVSAGAAADFNQDQKPDLVLGGRFAGGPTRIFYNKTLPSPCLTVNDVTVAEGSSGSSNAQFTVSLSAPAAQTVTVNYRVVGRSAALNSDFSNQTGTLQFASGVQMQTVNVPIIGDTKDEIDETFQLVLSNPVNASLADNIGVGTIIDDDSAPSVVIGDASILEGTGSTPTRMTFTVSLSVATGRKAKVGYFLLDVTAQSGSDFTSNIGTVVFNADQMTRQITVDVDPDAFVEPDETFKVKLAGASNLTIADDEAIGTILNDDLGGTVQFSSASYAVSEASDTVIVTVTRTGGAAAGIAVGYSTGSGTATANRDYLPSGGKLLFNAGETTKTFIIPILDDAVDEPNVETVNLSLDYISGGAVLGTQATSVLNISDDDPPPLLTMADVAVNEGNSGTTTADFSVRLLAVSELPVTVNFATADGTAVAPTDYVSRSGTLTFAPGETVKTISVTVNGDTQREPDETFLLNLSAPVNVVLQNTQSVGTIINDDLAVRRGRADFDGDGKTDISIFRPNTGEWWYSRSSDNQVSAVQFGLSTDRVVAEDFTGDGKTDIAFWRPSTGEWFILRSENGTFFSFPFGTSGDLPAPNDYDGDGRADAAVYRLSTGTWYIQNSGGSGTSIVQFGISEDKPVAADYDGDGKADIAIFRPSNGSWWYLRSSDNQFRVFSFGVSTDKPVAGDYTGDGKADIAVFRPATGEWFVQRSEDNSYFSFPFGTAGDIPAPGDYDGDGRFDAAVFRPQVTTWYVNRSSAGILFANFGAVNDLPISNARVP